MLVLSRYKNEKVQIGTEIVVKVLSIEGDKVRLGFDAPKEISILRSELLDENKIIEKAIPENERGKA